MSVVAPRNVAHSGTPSPLETITPVAPLDSKGLVSMITALMHHAREYKALALWQFVRYALAATYFWVGGSFLFGADRIHVEPTYHLIENIEPGGIRVHGLILFALAFFVAARPAFRKQTIYGLLATLFYSLLSTCLIAGGWDLGKPDLTAPALYLLVAGLSFALLVSVAPLAYCPAQVSRNRSLRDGGKRV